MSRPRPGRALLGVLAAALAAPGCIQDDGSRFNPIEAVVPSLDEDAERQIGLEFDREVERHVEVIHDTQIAGFLSDLGQSIVEKLEPQPFIYRFRVIKDPSLNAFAVPGGYVYFHSGTVLAAASLDELAGVMGHEIAHVKAHHYARMRKKTQIPDILVGLAGMAAAVATNEPGLLVASQAINVAVQLSYSREFETEADKLGGIFMTRAGYDPAGSVRFFERILAEKQRTPYQIPPYLFSHPDVEDRIQSIQTEAATLTPRTSPPRGLEESMYDAQARLAQLVDSGRVALPSDAPPADRSVTDPLLAAADRREQAGDPDGALVVLARAAATEPNDPRVPFRIGQLLSAQGRHEEAAEHYRRTVALDPSRAQVFFQLGLSYRELGERHRAVYAFEQASRRAGETSALRQRSEWEIEKLTFEIVPSAGFGGGGESTDTPAGDSVEAFPADARRMAFWAQLHPRFAGYAGDIEVRWLDPRGTVVRESPADQKRKPYLTSVLDFEPGPAAVGEWTVELVLREDVIARRRVRVGN